LATEEIEILKQVLAELREIKAAIKDASRQISQTIETNASI
jgi:hypothetical protein